MSFEQFYKAVEKIGVVVDKEDVHLLFQFYDQNCNGSLDYKEFSQILFHKGPAQTGPQKVAIQPSPAKQMNSAAAKNDVNALLQAFRDKIKQRGARGIIGLQRVFKIIDDDGSRSLSFLEFRKCLNDFRVDVPPEAARTLFSAFDVNGDGSIDYDEFLREIRGELN